MYIIPLCYFNTSTFLVVNLFFYIISVPLKWDTNDVFMRNNMPQLNIVLNIQSYTNVLLCSFESN